MRQSGGKGQYGHVVLKIEPNEPGKGLRVRRRDQGRRGAREFIPAVERGIGRDQGVLAGYPVVDVKGHADFRFVPRRGLERTGVQDGRHLRFQGRLPQGQSRSSWSR